MPRNELQVRLALAQQDVGFYAEQFVASRALLAEAAASFVKSAAAAADHRARLAGLLPPSISIEKMTRAVMAEPAMVAEIVALALGAPGL